MFQPFPDLRDKLFGREGDLAHLTERAEVKGLTAIVARPAMGKSWLLTELSRRLSEDYDPPQLVGFARSYGETPDLLLRAVTDLYARWLSDTDSLEQAKMVWDQQKDGLLPGVAKAVGSIFKELDPIAKPITSAVSEALNGLVAANATLKSGGLKLPSLLYEQARDLMQAVARVSGQPVVLILDQWEKSPDPEMEAKTLEAFLQQLEEWPNCHLFMALRPDERANGVASKLVQSRQGPAERYDLATMNLESKTELQRMLGFLRQNIAAAKEVDDATLLEYVDGYPGVIYKWTDDYWRERMTSAVDLFQVAEDAHEYRYRELDELLAPLDDGMRKLAIRLALLPMSAEENVWPEIRDIVLSDLGEPPLDDLRLGKILEARQPPSFGHTKRAEAIRRWLITQRLGNSRQEAATLIERLAEPIQNLDPSVLLSSAILTALLPTSRELDLAVLPQAICQASAKLFGNFDTTDDTLLLGVRELISSKKASFAPLMAMGLFNTLIDAKEEEELARRDTLLDELRALAEAWPEDAAVREKLAMGLVNTLSVSKDEQDLARRDTLLDELRALAKAWPEDAAVREQLAMGLFNTLNQAKEEKELARRDTLLDGLRALAKASPEDAAVREKLAMGLFNTLIDAKEEEELARRDTLLDELRALAEAWPEDAAVREKLAMGLFNTLNQAKEEKELARRDTLLDELRALAEAWTEDAAVREKLAMGLVNTLSVSKDEQDLARRDTLLDELHVLAKAWPEDAAVREQLAMGLFNTLIDAKEEEELARRDTLLDELRALAKAWHEDAAVRLRLAMGLVNTLNQAKEEKELARRDTLLDELRALAEAWPEDAAAREKLAMGLFDTLNQAKEEKELARRDTLLDELRALAEARPEEDWARTVLAVLDD